MQVSQDTSRLFCYLVAEHVTGTYPEDIDINELKNARSRIRRRVRIRHHVESGQPLESLTVNVLSHPCLLWVLTP